MLDLLEPQFRLNNHSRPAPPLAAIEEATRLGQCLQRLPQAVCDALRPSRDCRFISVKKCHGCVQKLHRSLTVIAELDR
jgi:hypothetical protein